MTEITKANSKTIKQELHGCKIVLYGAASTGKQVLDILTDFGIKADYFVDDDIAKHGTVIWGLPCLSLTELKAMAQKENVSVILSNIYAKITLEKLNGLPLRIYELYALISDGIHEYMERVMSTRYDNDTWRRKWEKIKDFFVDDDSKKIWHTIKQVFETKEHNTEEYIRISSSEEHYFVKPIPKLFANESVIVDCGSYNGEMVGTFIDKGFPFGKFYAIEADPQNYRKLVTNVKKYNLASKIVTLQCGVWDKKDTLNFITNDHSGSANRISGGGYKIMLSR